MTDQTQAFVRKFCTFFGGFLGKNPLDFIELFASDRDEIFTGAVGAGGSGKVPCSIMLFSQMHKTQADEIIRTSVFFLTPIYPLDFASLRFVVWLFWP